MDRLTSLASQSLFPQQATYRPLNPYEPHFLEPELEVPIEVARVSRSFGDVRAVDDVSFRVKNGEVVGLLGPNGAGKTTILRMIATLIAPDTGAIRVSGHSTTDDPLEVRARIGYHTGQTGLYARITTREFLHYFASLHAIPKAISTDRVDALIDKFQLHEFADRLCGNLSTGQSQRVSLARTLLADPPVIVFDEPTSGLDIVSAQLILDSLRGFADEGRAVLFSTHIMSEIELICDRVVLLHEGRVIRDDSVDGIVASADAPNLTRAFLSLVQTAEGST